MSEDTNIIPEKQSRRKPRAGEYFALEIRDVGFLVGYVGSTEAVWSVAGPSSGLANLVYIYRETYPSIDSASRGHPVELLLPPILTNNLPWARGYFRPLPKSLDQTPTPPVPDHCFLHRRSGEYYDETGRVLDSPLGLVGEFLLQSYRTIDDRLSDALRIQRAPS